MESNHGHGWLFPSPSPVFESQGGWTLRGMILILRSAYQLSMDESFSDAASKVITSNYISVPYSLAGSQRRRPRLTRLRVA